VKSTTVVVTGTALTALIIVACGVLMALIANSNGSTSAVGLVLLPLYALAAIIAVWLVVFFTLGLRQVLRTFGEFRRSPIPPKQ
jgi:hypothetical protein